MPPTDLDERLRRALALPGEPTVSSEAMGSVVSGLPRYRARRRAIGAHGRLGAGGARADPRTGRRGPPGALEHHHRSRPVVELRPGAGRDRPGVLCGSSRIDRAERRGSRPVR